MSKDAKPIIVSVILPPKLVRQLDAVAKKNRHSRSMQIRVMLERTIDGDRGPGTVRPVAGSL